MAADEYFTKHGELNDTKLRLPAGNRFERFFIAGDPPVRTSMKTAFYALAEALNYERPSTVSEVIARDIANLAWYFESMIYADTTEVTRNTKVCLVAPHHKQPLTSPYHQSVYLKNIHRGYETTNSLAMLASKLYMTIGILSYIPSGDKIRLDIIGTRAESQMMVFLWQGERNHPSDVVNGFGTYEYRALKWNAGSANNEDAPMMVRRLNALREARGSWSDRKQSLKNLFWANFVSCLGTAVGAIPTSRNNPKKMELTVSLDTANEDGYAKYEKVEIGKQTPPVFIDTSVTVAEAIASANKKEADWSGEEVARRKKIVEQVLAARKATGTGQEKEKAPKQEESASAGASGGGVSVSGAGGEGRVGSPSQTVPLPTLPVQPRPPPAAEVKSGTQPLVSEFERIARERLTANRKYLGWGDEEFWLAVGLGTKPDAVTGAIYAELRKEFQKQYTRPELTAQETAELWEVIGKKFYLSLMKILRGGLIDRTGFTTAAADEAFGKAGKYVIGSLTVEAQQTLVNQVSTKIDETADILRRLGAPKERDTMLQKVKDYAWAFFHQNYGMDLARGISDARKTNEKQMREILDGQIFSWTEGGTKINIINGTVTPSNKFAMISGAIADTASQYVTRYRNVQEWRRWDPASQPFNPPQLGQSSIAKQRSTAMRGVSRNEPVPLLVQGEHPFSRVSDFNPLFYRSVPLKRAKNTVIMSYGVKPSFYTEKMRTIGLLHMIGTRLNLDDPENFIHPAVPSRDHPGQRLFMYSIYPSLLHTKSITLQGSGKALMFGSDDKRILGQKCVSVVESCWNLLAGKPAGLIELSLKAIAKFATSFGGQYCEQITIGDIQWHVKRKMEGTVSSEKMDMSPAKKEAHFANILANMTYVWNHVAAKLRAVTELNKKRMYPLIKILWNSNGGGGELDAISQTKTLASLQAFRNNRTLKNNFSRPRAQNKWYEFSHHHIESYNYTAVMSGGGGNLSVMHHYALIKSYMSKAATKAELFSFQQPTNTTLILAAKFYKNMLVAINMLEDNVFDETAEPKFDLARNLGVLGPGEVIHTLSPMGMSF